MASALACSDGTATTAAKREPSLLGAQFVLIRAHGQPLPATYATNTQSNGTFYNQIVADTLRFRTSDSLSRSSLYRAIRNTGEVTALDPESDVGTYAAAGDSITIVLTQGALGGRRLAGTRHGDTLRLSVTWGVSDQQADVYLRTK
jgi:hypothetical protein